MGGLAVSILLLLAAVKLWMTRQPIEQASLRPGEPMEYAAAEKEKVSGGGNSTDAFVNKTDDDHARFAEIVGSPNVPQQMLSGIGGFFSNVGHWFSYEEEQAFHTYSTNTTSTTTTVTRTTVTRTSTTTTTELHPTLFCFEVLREKGYERAVVKGQEKRNASIFSCNEHMLLSSDGAFQVGRSKVKHIKVQSKMHKGTWGKGDMTTNSWMNTEVFINAWDLVLEEGGWWRNDWTVKVDPDAVFFPHRLQVILKHRHGTIAPDIPPTFFANCDLYNKLALYGALEVVSQNALGVYFSKRQVCKNLKWHGWGEDFWLETCMMHLGAHKDNGVVMMADDRCHGAPCSNPHKVAYHDFKSAKSYFKCWHESRKAER